MAKRTYLPLILTVPVVALGITEIVMQKHEVRNFTHEMGTVVAVTPAPCRPVSSTHACVHEIVEYYVDATHKNRIVSDVAQSPAPAMGTTVEVLVSRANRYDVRIGGLTQYYLNSTIIGFLCAIVGLFGVLATVVPQFNVTRQEAMQGKGNLTWTLYERKRK